MADSPDVNTMANASANAELQRRLDELRQELEEGELTTKGYQKRRTLVLSQYLGPGHVPALEQQKGQLGQLQEAQEEQQGQAERKNQEWQQQDILENAQEKQDREMLQLQEQQTQRKREDERQQLRLQQQEQQPREQQQQPRQGQSYQQASIASGGGLRVHNPEYSTHPSSRDESRAASMAAGNAPRITPRINLSAAHDTFDPRASAAYGETEERRSSLVVRMPGRRTSSMVDADEEAMPSHEHSRAPTMMSSSYAFNPANEANYAAEQIHERTAGSVADGDATTRTSTLVDQAFFSDFAGQQEGHQRDRSYGGPHRYSNSDAFSPTVAIPPPMLNASDLPPPATVNHLLPLEPRDVEYAVYDPHNRNVPMSKFDNIAVVLRHRARNIPKQPAFWVLDGKGKDFASITWDKFASRAEKVAQVIRDKSNLYKGDRVALVYRSAEVIDFAIALMGCFIAGVVAVPINNFDKEDYTRLNIVLTTTQAHLVLTTDANLKNFHRDITQNKLAWPHGVEWWKTNDFGAFHPKKKDEMPPLVVPDLAYIEFSSAPTGDLRGVVMSHRTIMHQMACLSSVIATIPTNDGDTVNSSLRSRQASLVTGAGAGAGEIILTYLDPRQSIGMILGVLLAVYGGHTTVYMDLSAVQTPGLYANLITKYKATLLAADYPGLKRAAYNYQSDPMTTRNFKKNFEPNFSSVKLCLIDTLTVDCEFHEILTDRWLTPLRNPRARELVAPMLGLPEHGGMVIATRDWLGGEERMGCPLGTYDDEASEEPKKEEKIFSPNGFSSLIGSGTTRNPRKTAGRELSEVLLDKESLKTNEVVVVAMGEEARKRASEPNTVRVGAFGYPIPDATLAIVDPETSLLCTPNVIGEVWVDSPSLSGGFWALPKHTESIFHARPYKFVEGNPTPMLVEPEFLRTGLLGTVIEGKIFVLGLYEDRLRQKVEWVEHGMDAAEYRYYFVQHLIISIMKNVPKIYDASAFDIFVNEEHLPVILLESNAASTLPTTSGGPPRPLDTPLLDTLSERCMEVLYQEHHLRVYCVMITAPDTLPRVIKNGRKEIGNMLCRRDFDLGSLPCVHVKFGVERAVLNLPVGVDPVGGIWSTISTTARQEILALQEKQYSGFDFREVVIDDRTSTPLNNFSNIVDLLQWRVARQAEELSYCTVDGRGKEGRGITWKKFDIKVASVATYLQNKCKLSAGGHVILMYTHSEDFVYAVHACFCLGLIAIPMAPLDPSRLNEDAPAFLHLVADFHVQAVIVNHDLDHLLKQKLVSQHLKQSAHVLRVAIPPIFNTAKASKTSSGCRDAGLGMKPAWTQPEHPVLIWTYWTPDQRRIAVQLSHATIMGMCKVQKETCQMTSSRPVLGCVRSTSGLGFVHTCLMGVFVGAPTYLVSPVDFANNPASLFVSLSRYKVKDTYATSQMLDHAMNIIPGKGFTLDELKNMMISAEGRPRLDTFQKVRLHFAGAGLDRTAINTIYSHVLNPMIASRSYMCIEPIELFLDTRALRRGLIYPVDPDSDPSALLVQDSGMVPVSTQIAIVNPETCQLCHLGEYGEIWVSSEACVRSFYGSKDAFDLERFNGRTVDGDPHVRYVRTGDLGFLHSVTRPIGPNGQQVEMQVLFVLGGIGETFEVNGLGHFPLDIEYSIERCHRNIVPGGSAVFQAGNLVVVLVEVVRKAYLASMVPVIVNAILNEHQLVVDIVAFVGRGDFPRSRLHEKQRGKILASWVTRKMRTIAQFSIRDPDGADSQITEVPEDDIPTAMASSPQQTRSTMRSTDPPLSGTFSPAGDEKVFAIEHDLDLADQYPDPTATDADPAVYPEDNLEDYSIQQVPMATSNSSGPASVVHTPSTATSMALAQEDRRHPSNDNGLPLHAPLPSFGFDAPRGPVSLQDSKPAQAKRPNLELDVSTGMPSPESTAHSPSGISQHSPVSPLGDHLQPLLPGLRTSSAYSARHSNMAGANGPTYSAPQPLGYEHPLRQNHAPLVTAALTPGGSSARNGSAGGVVHRERGESGGSKSGRTAAETDDEWKRDALLQMKMIGKS